MEKVKFIQNTTEDVLLPITWWTVKMYKILSVWETREIFLKYPWVSTNQVESIQANDELILKMCLSWNFENEDWSDTELNIENLKKLPIQDLNILNQKVLDCFQKDKKK